VKILAAWVLVLVGAAAAAPTARTGVPGLEAVEPPSWWAGHSFNPVRLMVRGQNLAGARFEMEGSGISPGKPTSSPSGTYAFFDVAIDPAAVPGRRRLEVVTPAGRAGASFELLKPLAREGRFQGLTSDDVVYLIMPDRFANGDSSNDNPGGIRGMTDRTKGRYYHGGDLQGIIDHLDYLKNLGVTVLWLTPLYANTKELYPTPSWSPEPYSDYHGYGPVDYYTIDKHLGDGKKLRELVDRAHAAGLKLVLDQVFNHTGPRHPWVKDPPTTTWYHGTPEKHIDNTFQKWLLIDPHATEEVLRPVLEGWYFGVLPDLNQEDPEVERYLTQNTLWWLGTTGADGLRKDVMDFVSRRFWSRCLSAVKREHPAVTVLGEASDRDPAVVSFFQGGRVGHDGVDTKIDSLFDFPLQIALRRAFIEGKPLTELAAVLSRDALYPAPEILVTLLGSHDEPRFMGSEGETLEGLKLAFAFLLTTRGIPLIYYGDEIAMSGGGDPDNRRDFPGGWRADLRSAFDEHSRTAREREMFEYLQTLTRLRAELEALRRGKLFNLVVTDQVYVYLRKAVDSSVIVALNNNAQRELLKLKSGPGLASWEAGTLKDRLGGGATARLEGDRISMDVPAHSAAVFVLPKP
jgi:glycosidase